MSGGSTGALWTQPLGLGTARGEWRVGAEVRHDDIDPIGLHLTESRARYFTVRQDEVQQTLSGAWSALAVRWTPWLRFEVGVRADRFDFDVSSSLAANSGSGSETLASPKASIAIGPLRNTEFFVAAGCGFHSNDARGASISVDPGDGVSPVGRVTALAGARGAEVGLRTALIPRAQLSLSFWQLSLDSELLFVGDGGATEATRPSRRRGVELGFYARPADWLILDADYAWTEPRFDDGDPAGDRIPGAVEAAASLGLGFALPSGWFGGARLRRLGPAALIEDDGVRSPSSTLVNVNLGRAFGERWQISVGVYNLLDAEANDVAYFYESQLPGEQEPVADVHFHPVEPRTVRATVRVSF